MLELLRKKKSLRILIVAGAAIAALAGAVYLYFHNPHSYPLPCVFYSLTGFYLSGMRARDAPVILFCMDGFWMRFAIIRFMTVLLRLLSALCGGKSNRLGDYGRRSYRSEDQCKICRRNIDFRAFVRNRKKYSGISV